MRSCPLPLNEDARLRAVHALAGLTADTAALFDHLCNVTRDLFGCPIARISVVEETIQRPPPWSASRSAGPRAAGPAVPARHR